ncbi:MAG: hypothetical protein L0K86_24435, partial [Actinomycetia bacterium]|nr:hypothetical protein [Actinomycetes bacterium]
ASTQKLLIFVCRRLDADAVAVVLCARSVDAELVRGLGTTVEADSLTADDARALVRHAWPGLGSFVTERIVEHAAGLPLALMEMPAELSADQRAGRAPLPSIMPAGRSLRSLYASRLGDLNNGTREALLIASFDHLGPDELAEALRRRDRGLSDLAPAERVRLVRVLDGVCDFTHPSVRSLVQSAAPASELATAHATLAEVFRDEPTRYATHAHGAAVATDTDVARALEVSARESERRGAYDEAAYHWELAARRHADPASVRSCRDAAVDSYLRVGIGPQTLVLLEQLCRDAESDVERARWRATEVDIRGWSDASSPADVADVVALGRTLAASPEPAERAAGTNLTVSLAGAQLAWGDYGAAAELVGVIRQAATDPMPVEPRLLCDVIDAMRGTSRGEALRGPWLDETDDAQLADASMFLSYVGVILGWLDETEMSRRVAERLRILVVERGGYATAALPLGLFNAQMMQHAGEWDRAYLEYAAAERLAQDADFVGPRALIALRYAYLAAARGDAATCHAARERVRVGAGSTMTSTQHLETCAVGLLHLSLGEYPDAADVLGRAARIERTMSSVISGYTTRFPDQYAAYWQLGRADELRDDLDEYTAAAHRLAHPT